MDRFGLDVLLPFEERVTTVAAMCERGHADKMILSQDASCFTDWFPPGLREQMAPNWHYLHVVQDVIPALHERGVSEQQVNQMMRENPRAFFERRGLGPAPAVSAAASASAAARPTRSVREARA